MIEKIFKGLLVLLGFGAASCNENNEFGQVDMYGVPVLNYTVKGRVVDAANNPVKGIRVTSGLSTYSEDDVLSGANGEFDWHETGFFGNSIELVFSDIDGEENGGEFAEKRVTVELSDEDMVAGGYDKSVGDVGLELKTEE